MLIAAVLFALTQAVVPANSPIVHLIGRFDLRDPAGPRCAWPGSAVEFRFEGKSFKAKLKEDGHDYLDMVVDGERVDKVKLEGDSSVSLTVPKGVHIVRFVKRTEAFVGTTQFLSFETDGRFLSPPKRKRSIEVIGDSISCGYGDEGASENERYRDETENANLAYGPLAAKALNADYTIVAWSGRKMWPDNTIPEIYDLAIPTDPTSKWLFRGPVPDAVVINLATNDFGAGNPDETKWTGAYEAFITRLRSHYPKALVLCAIGSMMNDNWPQGAHTLTTLRGYLNRMVSRINAKGDRRVKVIEFAQQKVEDGIGADWHPSLKTQQKMADSLVQRLKQELNW